MDVIFSLFVFQNKWFLFFFTFIFLHYWWFQLISVRKNLYIEHRHETVNSCCKTLPRSVFAHKKNAVKAMIHCRKQAFSRTSEKDLDIKNCLSGKISEEIFCPESTDEVAKALYAPAPRRMFLTQPSPTPKKLSRRYWEKSYNQLSRISSAPRFQG